MQLKHLGPAALAAVVAAQNNGGNGNNNTPLTTALSSRQDLSSILRLLGQEPTFLAQLSVARNVTFLAPSNNALNDFLNGPDATPPNATTNNGVSALLSYHVLNGTYFDSQINDETVLLATALNVAPYSNITGGQRVFARRQDGNATFFSGLKDMSSVIAANINFTGGTIHVINRVLTVPLNDTRTMVDMNLTAAAGAIRKADIGARLDRMRDLTMFIPDNEAFNRIGSVENGLSNDQLSAILQYHVVQGQRPLYLSALTNSSLTTLNGAKLTFTNSSGSLFVNSAKIIKSNVLSNNGVIHVIDNVLNPSNVSARPDATATQGSPAFGGATTGTAGVPYTSGVGSGPDPTPTSPPDNGGGNNNNPGSGNGGNGGNGGGKGPASGAAAPLQTGAVAAAALFGGAAMMLNM